MFHFYALVLYKATCKIQVKQILDIQNVLIQKTMQMLKYLKASEAPWHMMYTNPMVFHHNSFELIQVNPWFTNQKPYTSQRDI